MCYLNKLCYHFFFFFLVSCNILDLARQDVQFRCCHAKTSSFYNVLLQVISWLISTFIYFSLHGLRRMRE